MKSTPTSLYLCTKNAHLTLNSKTYVQVDGVAMGSPLGPVLTNIFMVELEKILLLHHLKI